jgi:hypothetical protein
MTAPAKRREAPVHVEIQRFPISSLCLSEIKLAHTDDEVRQEMA